MGPPLTVIKGTSERILIDGAGLCSPGQWSPWQRQPPTDFGAKIRAQLKLAMFECDVDPKAIVEQAVAGKVLEDPFTGEAVRSARQKGLHLDLPPLLGRDGGGCADGGAQG